MLGKPDKARLPVYGETEVDRLLKRYQASWRFGHFVEPGGRLFDAIDFEEDPFTCSFEEANGYVANLIETETPHHEYAVELRDELDETWERFAIVLAKEHGHRLNGDEPLKHRCHTVLGRPIPRDKWPSDTGIYAVRANDRLKIGWGKNIAKRLTGQQTFCPYPLELIAYSRGASVKDEKALHKRLSTSRLTGEWFQIDPRVLAVVGEMTGASR